ncbi:MAG: LarC family nickel insertion protein [Alphaproteobacteria bacterium]|nr:LarC family nickel insertion protein [Alphaproteobacteria bacterium]
MHIHLDPVGGVAGDMFVAALLAAFPAHREAMMTAIRAAGLPQRINLDLVPHKDHALTGRRFVVEEGDDPHHHGHTPFGGIRKRLSGSPLAPAVARRAVAIFALLADAEAKVHGHDDLDAVCFHELGAWDSIADIVGAAFLIEAIGAATWSVGSLPLGSGRVRSAHGALPVPAPATALLLGGFMTHDDGLAGERVTPTGAAILKHLNCAPGIGPQPRRLAGTGIGFGTKTFPGISNVLRALIFEDAAPARAWRTEDVAVIEFEVDDQAPEDLAVGLDRLRGLRGVRDVLQESVLGKKGRLAAHVRIQCAPERRDAVIAACFEETTTIGLRYTSAQRAVLPRVLETSDGVPVKRVRRPDGSVTVKTEIDAARAEGGAAQRERLRRRAADLAAGKPWEEEP